MEIPSVPMYINQALEECLDIHGIKPNEYQPAYGGISIGLDLYNTGPNLFIPPGMNDYKIDWLWPEQSSPKTEKEQFRKVFTRLIPTGLHLALPKGWVGIIQERGSIIKTSLKVRAGVIDPDYTGEVFVNCVNLGAHPWEMKQNEKLPFQLVVLRATTQFELTSQEDYVRLTRDATRKEGMIGSSNK